MLEKVKVTSIFINLTTTESGFEVDSDLSVISSFILLFSILLDTLNKNSRKERQLKRNALGKVNKNGFLIFVKAVCDL